MMSNRQKHSSAETGVAGPSAFSKMTLVYWKSKKFWLGKLLEHPEIMTQGRTLEELERNIREAFMLMALDEAGTPTRMWPFSGRWCPAFRRSMAIM
jgi:hypothetical protein